MSGLKREIAQPPGKKELPQDTDKWIKWAKEHPLQAAVMIKDWIVSEEGG
ncbi:MAG: hypothetical protein HQK97_09720 [Nitrospirae bacterium]|nr:hypothetical protein [Nitrospirota bacterium]